MTRVIKVGGREIATGSALATFSRWVASRLAAGERVVVVHGGGDEISALTERLGYATQRVNGERVTTPETMPWVAGVLAGPVNLRLVRALASAGARPVGLSGVSASTLVARVAHGGRLGLVGEPSAVSPSLLEHLLGGGFLPVVAPLAAGEDGGLLNVNADLVASALATALRATLTVVSDVPGVRDGNGIGLGALTRGEAEELVRSGVVRDGMVPKVRAVLAALDSGVDRAWIGRVVESGHAFREEGTSFEGDVHEGMQRGNHE